MLGRSACHLRSFSLSSHRAPYEIARRLSHGVARHLISFTNLRGLSLLRARLARKTRGHSPKEGKREGVVVNDVWSHCDACRE